MLAEFPDDYLRYRQRVPSWPLACAWAASSAHYRSYSLTA